MSDNIWLVLAMVHPLIENENNESSASAFMFVTSQKAGSALPEYEKARRKWKTRMQWMITDFDNTRHQIGFGAAAQRRKNQDSEDEKYLRAFLLQ